MIDEPEITMIPSQQLAVLHVETPRARMQQVMGPAIAEAMAIVRAQGIGPVGPWYAHHLRVNPEIFDFEICVPVSAPVMASGRVRPGIREALKVVGTVYHGPYQGLGGAWQELTAWIEANGCQTSADFYEIYERGPESSPDSSTWRTRLCFPVVE